MKLVLTRFFHLCMAVAMLLSSMGFGLMEHSCQMRGVQRYSIHADKAGCGTCQVGTRAPSLTPQVGRSACCKSDARYTHVEATSSLSHQLVKLLVDALALVGGGITSFVTASIGRLLHLQASAPGADYASPPPRSGRQLLVFVQTFLI